MRHIQLAIISGLCSAMPCGAHAQAAAYTVPPQSLASALGALARQSGRNILFAPDAVAGRFTRGVQAARSITAALDAVLKGSGLHYVIERDLSITIMTARGKPSKRSAAHDRLVPSASIPAMLQDPEIVVTAQRRAQDILDVPIALGRFSGRRLQMLGVAEFDRLSMFTPGLVVEANSPSVSSFGMRGITQNSGDSTREPRVSVFQDGVSISAARSAYVELFDVDRIEIVKGPQSTLYGRAAMTGALNVIQNKASLSGLDGHGEIEAGGQQRIDAMINLPLGGDAAIRLAGRAKHRGGYVDNALTGGALGASETVAGRIALRWQPTHRLRVDLIGNIEHNRPGGTPYKSIRYLPSDPATGAVLGSFDPSAALAVANDAGLEDGRALGLRRTLKSATLLVDLQLNDRLRLSSTTAYRDFDSHSISDQDGMALPLYAYAEEGKGTLHSQELRLHYERGKRFTAFAGLGINHETGQQRAANQYDERLMAAQLAGTIASPLPQPQAVLTDPAFVIGALQAFAARRGISITPAEAGAVAAALSGAFQEQNINRSRTVSLDAFADASWTPVEPLEISAGLRLSHDDKTSAISALLPNGASALGGFMRVLSATPATRAAFLAQPGAGRSGFLFQPTLGNGGWFSQSMTDTGFSWRGALRYKPFATTAFYASYARGRRPKVLSAGPPLNPAGPARFVQVPSETVDSFEIGAKLREPARKLSLEQTFYHYRYRNFQTTIFQDGALRSTNAGRANAYGAETTIDWEPVAGLALFATYAFNHARFVSGAYQGNRFRLSPDHRASLGAMWSMPLAHGMFAITPLYSWQSKQFFNDNNDRPGLGGGLVDDRIQDEFQKGHGLFDLRLSYAPTRGRWRISAFVTNLFNQLHLKDAGALGDGIGLPTLVAAAPRLWGLSLSLQP